MGHLRRALMPDAQNKEATMPQPSHLSLKPDQQGRISERSIQLGNIVETRRYAYVPQGGYPASRTLPATSASPTSTTTKAAGWPKSTPSAFAASGATPTFRAIG